MPWCIMHELVGHQAEADGKLRLPNMNGFAKAVLDPNDVACRIGRHWLGPLFRVDAEVPLQFDSVLFVRDLEDRQEL